MKPLYSYRDIEFKIVYCYKVWGPESNQLVSKDSSDVGIDNGCVLALDLKRVICKPLVSKELPQTFNT